MPKRHNMLFWLCLLFLSIVQVSSAGMLQRGCSWAPANDELGPVKDTYVSVGGSLGDPNANFGLADYLDIGKGFDGVCVTALQFDLSELPDSLETLEFRSNIIVYGDHTRKVKVSILVGQDWDETTVTGLQNPFNASVLWIEEGANLTTLTVGASTEEFVIDLANYSNHQGLLTLLFAPELAEESWISIQSRENQISSPPRLVFTEKPAGLDFSWVMIIVVVGLGAILIIWLLKKDYGPKKSPYGADYYQPPPIYNNAEGYGAQPPSNPTMGSPGNMISCPQCRTPVQMGAQFCSTCGARIGANERFS